MARRKPGVSVPRVDDPALQRFLEQVGEWVRVGNGEGRDKKERFVTLAELQAGTLDIRARNFGFTGSHGEGRWPGEDNRPITPVRPEGFVAAPGYGAVILRWDAPGYNMNYHAYAEILRATEDNVGAAEVIGISSGRVYADRDVEGGVTYYYWLRFVSTTNRRGPLNATAGTPAASAIPVDQIRDALTAQRWQPDTQYYLGQVVRPSQAVTVGDTQVVFQVTQAGVSGSSEPSWPNQLGASFTDGSVRWVAIEVGRAPFVTGELNGRPMVYMHGAAIENATIDDAKINQLSADKLFARQGTIAQALIGEADITSAMIQTAAITSAKIGWGQITQAHIRDASITSAKIDEVIQSRTFNSQYGWRIRQDGSAEFRGVVLSRPNVVADGVWTSEPVMHFRYHTGFGSSPEGWSPSEITLWIDTQYDEYSEIITTNGAGFAARVLVTGGHFWHSGDHPGSTVIARFRAHADVLFEIDHYPTGMFGPPGGRIFLKVTIPLPRDILPRIVGGTLLNALGVSRVEWALIRLT